MMDMGMYGTYGKPDSYPNYGFAGGAHHQASVGHHHHHHHHHHQSASVGHVSVSPSPELAATAAHYYPQTPTIPSPYSSTSSENFLAATVDSNAATSSNTPPQSFYTSSGAPVLHEDGTAIISSENGLSYTNLDYASVSSSSSFASHGSCAAATDHHQSYQQQQQHVQTVYRTEEHRHHHAATSLHHQVGSIPRQEHPDLQQPTQQQQQHHQSSHETGDYQIAPSYLHQMPPDDPLQHYGASASIRQDAYPAPQPHFKEETPDHVVYHGLQPSPVHGVHPHSHVHAQHHHHHHQPHHHPTQSQLHQPSPHQQQQQQAQQQQQQQQQSQVPTYKWMQVKRNVPKPAGEFYVA